MKDRRPFDPALRRIFDEQAAASADSPPATTDDERVRMARTNMERAFESRTSVAGLPNRVKTREVEIASGLSGGLYLPQNAGTEESLPVLVYLHGGGWVAGSVAVLDPFCRLLSEEAGVMIASVEYRLAPEHPYPAALEDTLTAFQWVAEHGREWGADTSRIALGGDSAGGNLAAAAANHLCNESKAHGLCALLLLYPVTDHPSAGHLSYEENATGYGLEANQMRWFWEQYAPGISPQDSKASPLQVQQVPELPPILVATAEYDVLRDEGIAYANKLKGAGIDVTHLHSEDMSHNFPATPALVGRFPKCSETLNDIAGWLRAKFATATQTTT